MLNVRNLFLEPIMEIEILTIRIKIVKINGNQIKERIGGVKMILMLILKVLLYRLEIRVDSQVKMLMIKRINKMTDNDLNVKVKPRDRAEVTTLIIVAITTLIIAAITTTTTSIITISNSL
jgi:hypothetical protein